MDYITVAIPKGRPFKPTLDVLKRVGLACPELDDEDTRSLLITCEAAKARFIIARPADVPTYVEHGAADLGIVGKDTLLEGRQTVYELLDLGYMYCRFVLAAPAGAGPAVLLDGSSHRRVATKFPRIAEAYFQRRGLQVETIYLHGAVELAPKVGLADMIVDITETGRTLLENDLVILDELESSTARLIANAASYRLKAERLVPLVRALRDVTAPTNGKGGR